MIRNFRAGLLAAAGLCCFTTSASAANVTWMLQNVTFNFNGIGTFMTGSYVYNFDTGAYSSVKLASTTTGALIDPHVIFSSGNQLQVVSGTGDLTGHLEMFMNFKSFMTNAGGTIAVTLDGVGTCDTSNCNSTSNTIGFGNGGPAGSLGFVTTVPEPASVLLTGGALFALCAAAIRLRSTAKRTVG